MKDKLEILRSRLPVGIQHGLALIKKADGDVDKAENIFKEEMIALVIDKTGVTQDVAIRHLTSSKFDINTALKHIDEERYSLTEKLLRRYNDKEGALHTLVIAIEEHYELPGQDWMKLEDIKHLSEELFCFLTVMEWVNHVDYEDLYYGIDLYGGIVTDLIEKKLLLPAIAETIKVTKLVQKSQFAEQEAKRKLYAGVSWTPEFSAQEKLFKQQRPLLIDALYEFVKKNIDKFP